MGKFPDQEAEMYKRAEHLRQALLYPYERQVDRAREALQEDMERRDQASPLDALDLEFQFTKHRGLQAQEAFEESETTIDILNGCECLVFESLAYLYDGSSANTSVYNSLAGIDSELLWKWRGMIFAMLRTGVTIAGDDATGEEYAERAELQEKLNCYL